MKYDPKVHGRSSRHHPMASDALRKEWAVAESMGPEWIPTRSVHLADGVQPRDPDPETVQRYAENFDALPPIKVQRETLTLIDGLHRLHAAAKAGMDYIKAKEEDVSGDELVARAFLANTKHGRSYTAPERVRGLRAIMDLPEYRDMDHRALGRLCGVDRETVAKYRAASRAETSTTHEDTSVLAPAPEEFPSRILPDVRESLSRAIDEVLEEVGIDPGDDTPLPPRPRKRDQAPVMADESDGSREAYTFLRDGAGLKISVTAFGPATARRAAAFREAVREAIAFLEDGLEIWTEVE